MKSRRKEQPEVPALIVRNDSKDEAAAALTKAGYPAANIDGVVMIDNEKVMTEKDILAVHRIFKEIGYNASWGCHGYIDDKPKKARRRRK